MRTFTLADWNATVRFHDLPGRGRPLVFVHGLGCASSCDYPRVACDAALGGRRAVLVDLLGSGFSDRPADFPYTVESHADVVARLVRHLDAASVDLFGHSMGGAVAIVAASLLGSALHALVLSEPNLDAGGGTSSRLIAAQTEDAYVSDGHQRLVRQAKAEGNDVWAGSMAQSSPAAIHRGATSLVRGGEICWRTILSRLPVAKTVVFGERSLPDHDTEVLPANGVRVEIVPDAGHSMMWENPGGLALAVARAIA